MRSGPASASIATILLFTTVKPTIETGLLSTVTTTPAARSPGHREPVVQHQRQTFRRRQRVQDDQQREPDGVGQERLVLGLHPGLGTDHGIGEVGSSGTSGCVLGRRSRF
jgi:hypothetical protein